MFTDGFDTTNSEGIINTISINEFWDFDGAEATQVTLTWNSDSEINQLVDELINLRVVGWSILENRWLDLGNVSFTGDINSGTITSTDFIPNDFEIITFGSLIGSDGIVIYNIFSPNGDGVNDFFVIEGVELFENDLKVYNRYGNLVFKANNYQNDWDGVATEGAIVINRAERLPVGTYFYTLNLINENRRVAGWVYINY